MKFLIALLLVVNIGCSMERIPAVVEDSVQVSQYDFPSCEFHSFQVTNRSLLPDIRCIDCSVEHELAPEEVEFEFTHNGGELFGKQSKKRIEVVNIETNEYGVNYYLNYTPLRGIQDSLGRWCCWYTNSDVPTESALLPDELNQVHIESDGGMVYRASWNVGESPRGLAFILCGLGGMQHSSKMLGHALLKEDWAVVYLYTVLNVPEYSMNVQLHEVDPVESAIEIFNTKFCQVIVATKAIRLRMEEQHPSLAVKPFALIGISAGALNTPAVYQELHEDVDAVVLVAGGANMLDIVQDGAFTNWKFTDSNEKRFTKKELENMNEKYLKTPSRDPYFLAPLLPRENTLLIHAAWDSVVPAENGDLLYERAGRPERWIYPSGHLGLFATFGWHANDITEWLNQHTSSY